MASASYHLFQLLRITPSKQKNSAGRLASALEEVLFLVNIPRGPFTRESEQIQQELGSPNLVQAVRPELKLSITFVAATCAYTRAIDRSSRAGYRSIFLLTSLASTRAGQSGRRLPPVPIRMPEW